MAFFILAPMDDVTDTVFRRIVADCAAPDMTMTEFVNVDGLTSVGRPKLMHRLSVEHDSVPVIAQIWGKKPENFKQIADEIASGVIPGFAGVDINFGCPEKSVVKNECCSALAQPQLRDKALAIINATKEGLVGRLPLSIKTRLGFKDIDYSWHEFLLEQKPDMLTVHVRTTREMSKVPARWEAIEPIVILRDRISPNTKIVLNGDVMNREQGEKLARKHGVDGIMIGRGVFHDPYCFAPTTHQPTCQLAKPAALSASSDATHFSSPVLTSPYDDTVRSATQRENAHHLEVHSGCKTPWQQKTKQERIDLLKHHMNLHEQTYPNGARPFNPLKKFAKIYISDFPGASELRDKVMHTSSVEEAIELLQ
ncbi:tRNA-dihydrouridine synthase [Candidatus Saccharibacteria bacterium]|nr:tRNA-dihydrouridine synthase [Candidatus Saccharibacteria bacterium]